MKRMLVTLLFMALQMGYAHAQQALSLGIKIVIQNTDTAERVLLNANRGVDDGDVGRVAGLKVDRRLSDLPPKPDIPTYRPAVGVGATISL